MLRNSSRPALASLCSTASPSGVILNSTCRRSLPERARRIKPRSLSCASSRTASTPRVAFRPEQHVSSPVSSPSYSQGEPLIARYTRPEMGRIWTDENKFRCWLQVEAAASLTLAEAGIVPPDAARAIAERGDFALQRIQEIEAEVKHDVIAFTTAVAEKVGPLARWLHYGLTSNDVVDTAQALQIKEVSQIILKDLHHLRATLQRRAYEFK